MRTVLLAGATSNHVVLVRSSTGRIVETHLPSGIGLVRALLDGTMRHGGRERGTAIDVRFVPDLVEAGSVFLAQESQGAIVLKERLGERADSRADRGTNPTSAAGPDLAVIFDGDSMCGQVTDRPTGILDPTRPQWIVLRVRDPGRLYALPKIGAEHRVITTTADALRAEGANIGNGRSWDESFVHLMAHIDGPGADLMRIAGHVLVRFGTQALVHVRRGTERNHYMAYFLPAQIEENAPPTEAFGLDEVFHARLIMEVLRTTGKGGRGPLDLASRLPFASREALRSVIRYQRSGWRAGGEGLALAAEVFGYNEDGDEPIAGAEISDLPERGSLLRLATHGSTATLLTWAMDHVRTGRNGLLGATPVVEFGEVVSIDRDEIEQYRTIRQAIMDYVERPGSKPMSFGVFGPPGSGKTFGVEQIKDALGDVVSWMKIDMSGFAHPDQLLKELRLIRDANLNGSIPFVLFDEFDSTLHGTPYGWFQHFLRPVENGVFREDAADHPVGSGIFVFTGGTCHSYAEFRRKSQGGDPPDPNAEQLARERKMPDMARRLVAHIDVKGISAVPGEPPDLYLARRAIVLRKQLLGREPKDRMAVIEVDQRLLTALLTLEKFHNGTSSMCKLLARSRRSEQGRYLTTSLPPDQELEGYLDPGALRKIMNKSHRLQHAIEPLARLIHENWRPTIRPRAKKAADVPWEDLPEAYRDSNRLQAFDMVRKLEQHGYRAETGDPQDKVSSFSPAEVENMARMEHDRWMREKLATGWTLGAKRDDRLRIHPLLVPFDSLTEDDKELDRDPVRKIPEFLAKVGWGVVRLNGGGDLA